MRWPFIYLVQHSKYIQRWLSRCKQLRGLVPVVRLGVPLRCKASKLWYPLKIPLFFSWICLFNDQGAVGKQSQKRKKRESQKSVKRGKGEVLGALGFYIPSEMLTWILKTFCTSSRLDFRIVLSPKYTGKNFKQRVLMASNTRS